MVPPGARRNFVGQRWGVERKGGGEGKRTSLPSYGPVKSRPANWHAMCERRLEDAFVLHSSNILASFQTAIPWAWFFIFQEERIDEI